MKVGIWLNFDLGIRGEYERLYSWLDDQGAKECGPNTAFFRYTYQKDFLEELTAEIQQLVGRKAGARIYVIHSVGKAKGAKGQWLIGGRKSPPWTGFGSGVEQEIDQG